MLAAAAPGCSHRVAPTDRYRDPASLPIPFDVTVAQTAGAIIVSWSGGDDVFEIIDGWNVYRRESLADAPSRLNRAPVIDVNYVDPGIVEGASYLYTVRSVSPAGVEGLPSHEIEFRYDAVPPDAPTALVAVPGENAIRLRWTPPAAPDLDSFRVYRDGDRIASLVRAAEYLDMPVSPDGSRFYEVTAVDTRGNESERSGGVTATALPAVDRTPPAAPTGLAAAPGDGGVRLTWNPVADPDLSGYLLYRKEEGGTAFERVPGSALLGATEYVDAQVAHRSTYVWQVTAVDTSGNESAPGAEATLRYLARIVDTGGNDLGSVYPWCGAASSSGRMQFLVPVAELGRPGRIESVAQLLRGGAAVYRNVTVELAHTTAGSLVPDFASNRGAAAGMVPVFGPETVDTEAEREGGVVPFRLSRPFDYDGARNLLVEIAWSGDDGRTATFGFATRPGTLRRLWRQPDPAGSPMLEESQQFLRIAFTE
jgi:hypothetical protein